MFDFCCGPILRLLYQRAIVGLVMIVCIFDSLLGAIPPRAYRGANRLARQYCQLLKSWIKNTMTTKTSLRHRLRALLCRLQAHRRCHIRMKAALAHRPSLPLGPRHCFMKHLYVYPLMMSAMLTTAAQEDGSPHQYQFDTDSASFGVDN